MVASSRKLPGRWESFLSFVFQLFSSFPLFPPQCEAATAFKGWDIFTFSRFLLYWVKQGNMLNIDSKQE